MSDYAATKKKRSRKPPALSCDLTVDGAAIHLSVYVRVGGPNLFKCYHKEKMSICLAIARLKPTGATAFKRLELCSTWNKKRLQSLFEKAKASLVERSGTAWDLFRSHYKLEQS
jgi:hypothetical protein